MTFWLPRGGWKALAPQPDRDGVGFGRERHRLNRLLGIQRIPSPGAQLRGSSSARTMPNPARSARVEVLPTTLVIAVRPAPPETLREKRRRLPQGWVLVAAATTARTAGVEDDEDDADCDRDSHKR